MDAHEAFDHDRHMIRPRFGPVIVHTGWFSGLPALVAREVLSAGFKSKEQVRTAVLDGRLSPQRNFGLGPLGYLIVCEWLEVPPESRQLSGDGSAAEAPTNSADAESQPIRGAGI
jgi:hypothetical protein